MKEEIKISISGKQVEELCINYIMNNTELNIKRENIELVSTVVKDNRVNEWENSYLIKRLDFKINNND